MPAGRRGLGFLADLGPVRDWGELKSYLNPKECIDCGACGPVCPVQAISQGRLLPAHAGVVLHDSSSFLDVLPGRGAPSRYPRGARKVGALGVDTPLVGDWPSQA